MRMIHKYVLNLTPYQVVNVRESSRVLSVKKQQGNLCMWVIEDITKPNHIAVEVFISGTGQPAPDGGVSFVDTVVFDNDDPNSFLSVFVWHVFYRFKTEINNG